MKFKFELGLVMIVLLVSTLVKVIPILNYNFPFTPDQGRDMLALREIVQGRNLTLIGPTTSINGVYLGPFWHYFNLIPYLLGQGDPAFLVYWMIFWYQLAGFLLWLALRRLDRLFAVIVSLLFLTTPAFFYSSRFSWSANPMPPLTALYFLTLILSLKNPRPRNLIGLGILSGILFQIEASLGVIFFPFTLLALLSAKGWRLSILALTSLGYFFTLIPQILFDLRHNFLISRNFLAELLADSPVLGQKLTFRDTLFFHLNDFRWALAKLFEIPGERALILYLSLAVAAVWIYLKEKPLKYFRKFSFSDHGKAADELFLLSLLLIVLSFVFFLAYPYSIKGWYLMGLYIPLIFIAGKFLTLLPKAVLAVLLISIIGTSFYGQKDLIFQTGSGDRSTLANELKAVDWVYQKAQGKGFAVYSYLPSVYDFTYQYLFWWYGRKEYGFEPARISYLEGVPEYIPDNERYRTLKRPASPDFSTFLIVENNGERPDQEYAWLGNFTRLCEGDRVNFSWAAKVIEMKVCP